MSPLLERLGVRLPIFQAPMAGGVDSPALAAAVSEAGGLGALGCGYLTDAQIEAAALGVRALTQQPFALNLFVFDDAPDDAVASRRVMPTLSTFRTELGLLPQPAPAKPSIAFEAQVAAVLRLRPRVLSFTFGLPQRDALTAIREAEIFVIGTATNVDEADALEALGVDAICAQGGAAGGHRGTFIGNVEDSLFDTLALTRQLLTSVKVPVIAAGGIMDREGVRAALDAGAIAAQLGTAFMLCPEAGTHASHRAAFASPMVNETVITRAFSGREARGMRNRMTSAFEKLEAAPFPQQQRLTAELRAAAAVQGRTDLMQLWAGQGAARARALPAAELVHALSKDL